MTSWKEYIDEKISNLSDAYLNAPDLLFSAYNTEESNKSDYHGRELFELIQNADDAGYQYGYNKIKILIVDDYLIVANTGIPFSMEGIRSLMICALSPKNIYDSQCIGHKGLGLRSLLNWADCFFIYSDKTIINFDKKQSYSWLSQLRKENQSFHKIIAEYEDKQQIKNPVPILLIPEIKDSISSINKLSPNFINKFNSLAEEYNTLLCFQIKELESIEKQISELLPNTFLFLNNLESICVQSPKREINWTIKRSDNRITVDAGDVIKSYKILKQEGAIPSKLIGAANQKQSKYKIVLAVPEENESFQDCKLYSFFPTEVGFAFPFYAHATFELIANRTELNNSPVNKYIIKKLARFMAETAESLKNKNNPWQALEFLCPDKSWHSHDINENLKFDEYLNRFLSVTAIYPSINRNFHYAKELYFPQLNLDLLKKYKLENWEISLYPKDEKLETYLNRTNSWSKGVKHSFIELDDDDLVELLNEVSARLTINDRAKIIIALIDNGILNQNEMPNLLIDEKNNVIDNNLSIFLPSSQPMKRLPKWLPQRIVSKDLIEIINKHIKQKNNERMYSYLKKFNVIEYNLKDLASSLSKKTNDYCKEFPEKEFECRIEVIKFLFNEFQHLKEKPPIKDQIGFKLPTRLGEYESAKNLYFGQEYNQDILENLYGELCPKLFLLTHNKMGLSGYPLELVISFFEWLGINKKPRIITQIEYSKSDYFNYIKDKFPYKLEFSRDYSKPDIFIQNTAELDNFFVQVKVSKIHLMDKILEVVHSNYVLAALTLLIPELTELQKSDKNFVLEAKTRSQNNYRTLNKKAHIPSYTLWLLQNTKWMSVINSTEKRKPINCILSKELESLSEHIGVPDVDRELLEKYHIEKHALDVVFNVLSVPRSIEQLELESFYSILFQHANIDKEGINAKELYSKLIQIKPYKVPEELHEKFIKEGVLFGNYLNKKQYYPVSELFYAESLVVPEKQLSLFPLLDLDIKKDSVIIENLLGVQPLLEKNIDFQLVSFEQNINNDLFALELEHLKLFIYTLIMEKDSNYKLLKLLNEHRIIICDELDVSMTYQTKTTKLTPKIGEHVKIDQTTYILFNDNNLFEEDILMDHYISNAIGEIYANLTNIADIANDIIRIARSAKNKRKIDLYQLIGASAEEKYMKALNLLTNFSNYEVDKIFSQPEPQSIPKSELSNEDKEKNTLSEKSDVIKNMKHNKENSLDEEIQNYNDLIVELNVNEKIDIKLITGSLNKTDNNMNKSGTKTGFGKSNKIPINGKFNLEDGARGEKWVALQEGKLLSSLGIDITKYTVNHISLEKPLNPWDIESWEYDEEKNIIPIKIEVKSTSEKNGYTFPMSPNEYNAALNTAGNKNKFYIYRVFDVRSSCPRIEKIDFFKEIQKGSVEIKAKSFYVTLKPY